MKIDASAYHAIPIIDNGEPLVELTPKPGVKFFDRTRFQSDYTKGVWLRATAAEKLYAAGAELFDITDGAFELYIRDGYRTINCQQRNWAEGLARLVAEIGDADASLASAGVLYSDPTGFDENDPSTWPAHTPIHSTGGAADVFMISNDDRKPWTYIDGYRDRVAHYATDYFEDKKDLSEIEECVKNNRRLLTRVMKSNGFVNYPNEAWHFDFGDQMYAFLSGAATAIYGYVKNPES